MEYEQRHVVGGEVDQPDNVAAVVADCHHTVFYDNSADDGPSEVASYRYEVADYPFRWPGWAPEPLLEL